MKKFLKAALAIAVLATMLVANIVSVSAAENLATSATYTITRLTAGPGSDDEGAACFLGEGRGDDVDFNRLNDGWAEPKEKESTKSVMLAGTARTHRITFDLGAEKEVSTVVIKCLWDTYRREYQGAPAGNRGFELNGIKVYAGVELTDLNAKASETQYMDEEGAAMDWYDVTLTFSKVTTKIITIDLPSAQPGNHSEYGDKDKGAYVVTLNEIEIYGGAAPATQAPTQADNTTAAQGDTPATAAPTVTKPASDTPKAGDITPIIAVIAIASLAGAAVVLKKKSF